MHDAVNTAVKSTLGKVWEDVAGYLSLYDFVKLRLASASGRTISISDI